MPKDGQVEELLELAGRVVERARAKGADVAEASASSGFHLTVTVRDGERELLEEAGSRAVGMRVIHRGRVGLISTSDLTPRGLDQMVDDALELAELAQPDPFAGPADEPMDTSPPPDVELYDVAAAGLSPEVLLDWAERGEAAALAEDERVERTNGASAYRTESARAIVLSGGFSAGYRSSSAGVSVSAVAPDEGGKKRRGGFGSGRRHLDEVLTPEEVGQRAARRAVDMLGARKIKTTEVPVVFDPEIGRSILGLFVGCVLGGSLWRRSSYLLDSLDEQVASSLVTLVDEPRLPRAMGSRPYDGEGVALRDNLVVEAGKLRTFLLDSYSARKLKRASTGSAVRGGNGGVGPAISNLTLRPTDVTRDALMKDTKSGLYVTQMMGHGFNPTTGDFSRGVSGFWIDQGELAYPVVEANLSINFKDLFNRIDAIADDLNVDSSVRCPTFRVAKMTVAGEG